MLVLTARDATPDKVDNFEAGADDYLTKPFAFAFAELVVRVKALLRRSPFSDADRRRAGGRFEVELPLASPPANHPHKLNHHEH